jgi:hypothetical protein
MLRNYASEILSFFLNFANVDDGFLSFNLLRINKNFLRSFPFSLFLSSSAIASECGVAKNPFQQTMMLYSR